MGSAQVRRLGDGVLASAAVAFSLIMSVFAVTAFAEPASTVMQFQVSSGDNDAEERENGKVSLTRGQVVLGEMRGQRTVAFRFDAVTLPPGVAISAAFLQLTASGNNSTNAMFEISIEASDNAPLLSKKNFDLSTRPLALPFVSWNPSGWSDGERGTDQRTPDIGSLIQAVVDRPGWTSGSSMVLVVTGTGTRVAQAFNQSPADAAALEVVFDGPPPVNVAPVVDAGSDQSVTLGDGAVLAGSVSDDGLPVPPGVVSSVWSLVSGPGVVTFGDGTAVDTAVSFTDVGTYVLRLVGDDGELSSSDEMTVEVAAAPPVNVAPVVDAGSDQSVTLGDGAVLAGSVSDDGLPVPPGVVSSVWSLVSGPGVVTFGDDTAVDTAVSFTDVGTYVLRLVGDDGELSSSDEMTVEVAAAPPVNVAPVVDAGSDQSVTLGDGAVLAGSVSDDGLPVPPGVVSSVWSLVSGPGVVTFGDGTAVDTAVSFTDVGTYVLRLVGDDGELSSSDEMTVEVAAAPPVNVAPVVDAGSDQSVTLGDGAVLAGSVSDDGLPVPPGVVSSVWSLVSGPGVVTFGDDTAVDTAVSFTDVGTYVLRLVGDDGELSSSDEMTVEVAAAPPVNVAPVVDAGSDQSVTLGDGAVLAGSVSDDGLPVPPGVVSSVWSLVSGPGVVTFGDGTAVDTAVSFTDVGTYVLRLVGDDGELSSSDEMTVEVAAAPPVNVAPVVDAGSDQSVTLGDGAVLAGSVSDDGLPVPPGVVSSVWSLVSGPGVVTFGDGTAVDTAVSFTDVGTYVLRLVGDDGELSSSDEMTVEVAAAPPVTTLEIRVGARADDAEENLTTGSIDLSSSDLELVEEQALQIVGIRLDGVNIPYGATVLSAALQFTVDETDNAPTFLEIRGEANDNAVAFTSANADISARSTTSASVSWVPPPWTTVGDSGADQRSPDLSAIIQEVVDRTGWIPGNAIVLLVSGTGQRTAESFNGVAASAPLLTIDYSITASALPAVTISSPASGQDIAENAPVAFNGTATDLEDGDLSGSLQWSSDIAGPIGIGPSFTASLPPGFHRITAAVIDSDGRAGSDFVDIRVDVASPTLIGAGDIARCSVDSDTATADIIWNYPGATVFTAGDNAYSNGTAAEFANCYDPTWGAFLPATRPAAGNHDYHVADAVDYYAYFGSASGNPGEGWYSYDLGTWHVIVLNSNCAHVGCGTGSPQFDWLERDLAEHAGVSCVAAYWHHPRFSSGSHGSNTRSADFWSLLYSYGADVVMNGHEHSYERFGAMNPFGGLDPDSGIRQFVVGTGGTNLKPFLSSPLAATEVRSDTSHGVLRLELGVGIYDWEFHPIAGASFSDSGSAQCVDPGDAVPVVSMVTPSDQAYTEDDLIAFSGSATDAETGDVSDSIVWKSDRDGVLGQGSSVVASGLSIGIHEIVAEVVDELGRRSLDSTTLTISPGSGNQPPSVDAGQDSSMALGSSFTLAGEATDDGTPNPPGEITFSWTLVDGPGPVAFDAPAALVTSVTPTAAGSHVIRLSASDGALTSVSFMILEVIDFSATQTFETKVSRSSGDAEEAADGKVAYGSSDLDLGTDVSAQTVGVLFGDIGVPAGATITAAYIQFTADETSSGPSSLEIRGEATDSAAPFSAIDFNISTRPVTSAAATWEPNAWNLIGESDLNQRTTDLAAIVQEIVDRPGWLGGGEMAFFIAGSGTRVAESFNGSPADAPILYIQFRYPIPPS